VGHVEIPGVADQGDLVRRCPCKLLDVFNELVWHHLKNRLRQANQNQNAGAPVFRVFAHDGAKKGLGLLYGFPVE